MYRTKDRSRYASTFGGNSTIETTTITTTQSPLRYSVDSLIGDYNNVEVSVYY